MLKKIVLTLFVAGLALTPRPGFAGFLDQLLESAVGGSSSGNSNNVNSETYNGNVASMREDERHLDEAYSQLRQKQAAGQDTTAELENIRVLEETYRSRKQQVREQGWQLQQAQRRQQMNYDRQRYANQNNNNYSNNNSYQQNNGYQNQGGNSFFDNNNDPYGNQDSFQDDDNDGFRVRFGG